MGSECFCFGLAKNISILMVFLQNGREVNFFGDGSRFGLHCGTENVIKPERHEVQSRASALIIAI